MNFLHDYCFVGFPVAFHGNFDAAGFPIPALSPSHAGPVYFVQATRLNIRDTNTMSIKV